MTTKARNYIWTILGTGVLASILSLLLLPTDDVPVVGYSVLAAIAFLSVLVPLRFHRRGGAWGVHFEGGVLVALLMTVPVGLVPILHVGAAFAAHSLRTRSVRKVAFNTGQAGVLTGAASVAFFLLVPAPSEPLAPMTLFAVSIAALVYEGLTVLTMAELFHSLDGTPRRSAVRDVSSLTAYTYVGNTAYGVVLATLVGASPWVAALSGLFMIGMFVGYRGYVGALEGQKRARALNRLTRRFLDLPGDGDDRLPNLLRSVAALFGASVARLVLTSSVGTDEWRVEVEGTASHDVTTRRSTPELRRLEDNAFKPVIVDGGQASDDAPDSIIAPINRDSSVAGLLQVTGRRGFEAWEQADADLLAAVANELSIALENVDLFEEVERERARLEAESTKLADVLGAASDGIALIAGDGTIETWNPGMAGIIGVADDQAVGQPWFVVMRLRDDAGNEIMPDSGSRVAQALRGEQLDHPVLLQGMRRDGTWRWLQCTVSPVAAQGETPAGSVLVARDVTAEHEVDELKNDFIATVSHELRTPLTPLKGFLTTLRRTGGDIQTASLDRVFEAMSNQVNRLEALISDLLAVAELDSGQFDLHPEYLDLADQVAAAAEVEVGPDIADRLHIDVRRPVSAIADPLAVIRIVRALVGNAVKHTQGPVTVQIDADDERAIVRVIDTGPGIPPWEQNRIFGRFERLGDHLQRTQGPGLGLTIARALAHRMQGDVTIESDVGTGSTFTLTLPIAHRPRLRLASSE